MFAINIPTVAIQRAAVTFFLFANFVYEKFCGFIHNDGNIVVQYKYIAWGITIDDIFYLDPETINGLNLYSYCGNHPVMGTDSIKDSILFLIGEILSRFAGFIFKFILTFVSTWFAFVNQIQKRINERSGQETNSLFYFEYLYVVGCDIY